MARLLSAAAIAALIIAGCASDDDAADPTTTTEPATASSVDQATTAAPAPTTTSRPSPTQPPSTTTTAAPSDFPVDISAGVRHSCMVWESGKVSCWGENDKGQLGDGEFGRDLYSSAPVEVSGIADAVDVSAGWEHTCAVHATGEVSCWGDDTNGELGNGEISDQVPLPVKAEGITDATAVTAGHLHTCALRSTGEIACWGRNHDGQLGNGEMGSDDANSAVPVAVLEITDAVTVSAGGEHTCAVHATGEVSCWGDNFGGELGSGQNGNEFDSAVPVKVAGISDAVDVSSDQLHTCVLREGGSMSCWGDNTYGQLGGGDALVFTINQTLANSPVDVLGIDDATGISAGSGFTCVTRQGGQALCWGRNNVGQLGSPDTQNIDVGLTPTPVLDVDDAVSVSAGTTHACVLRESREVSCWGSNFHGQLGNALGGEVSTEQVQVQGVSDAVDVSSSFRHTCATHATGEVSCWGQTWKGRSGDDATGDAAPLPVKVAGITDATGVSASAGVSCASLESSEASCWGFYWDSEFTENDDGDISPVSSVWRNAADIERVATGGSHGCALKTDSTVICGGANWYGNLGTGQLGTTISWAPQEVLGIDDATDIALGFAHTCAAHATGEVSCWGRNELGQLGTGEENLGTDAPAPAKVLGITDATAVAAGNLAITCALHATGEVSCWGSSSFGTLGTAADPASDHSAVPVKIEGVTDATAVSIGFQHVCALHESGEVSCWGADFLGQLGTTENIQDGHSATPVRVPGIDDASFVSAGASHTCAVHTSGQVTCWGWDENGQLGDGEVLDPMISVNPVTVFGT